MDELTYYETLDGRENAYTINAQSLKFGAGVLAELGPDAVRLGMKRVAFFIDKNVDGTEPAALAKESLRREGVDFEMFTESRVEPTDRSILLAGEFAQKGAFDGFISLGGGSVIDTAKAANLLASYPDDLMAYIYAPLGGGKAIPGPVMPHIACPTTSGTGSETSVVSIFDLEERRVKAGVASPLLRPTLAVVDPTTTHSMPAGVVAATGFDVLSHAIESYTARPFSSRPRSESPDKRPPYQGANPYADIGSLAAIRIGGRNLVRAVNDPEDQQARHELMFAATLAGQAFGNAGVHIPHAMATSVSGLRHTYRASGYECEHAMVPHGISVVLNTPAVFRFTAPAAPQRHLEAAAALGADVDGADPSEAGLVLAGAMIRMMKETRLPNGLKEVGYSEEDIPALVKGAIAQKRLLLIAPREVTEENLAELFKKALRNW